MSEIYQTFDLYPMYVSASAAAPVASAKAISNFMMLFFSCVLREACEAIDPALMRLLSLSRALGGAGIEIQG